MPSFPPCVSRLPLHLHHHGRMLLKLADRANIAAGRLSSVQTPGLTEPPAAASYSFSYSYSLLHPGEQQATRDLKWKSYAVRVTVCIGRWEHPTRPNPSCFCRSFVHPQGKYVNYPKTKSSFPRFHNSHLPSSASSYHYEDDRRRRPVDSQSSVWLPAASGCTQERPSRTTRRLCTGAGAGAARATQITPLGTSGGGERCSRIEVGRDGGRGEGGERERGRREGDALPLPFEATGILIDP